MVEFALTAIPVGCQPTIDLTVKISHASGLGVEKK